MRLFLIALLLALPHAASAQWYVGTFTGVIPHDSGQTTVTVTCKSGTQCEYSLRESASAADAFAPKSLDAVQEIDVAIMNNNLDFTRNAVKGDPAAYDNPREGMLLRALRTLLEYPVRFDACVGQPEKDGAWGRICRVDDPSPRLPEAVLAVTTMNPTCRGQRFCAYYFFPLRRTP
jgi:hypothetical protein